MPRGQARRPRCPAGQHRNAEGECVPREEVFANIEARRRDRGRARRDNTAQSPRAGGSATFVPPPRSEATPAVDAPRPPTTAPPRGRGARSRAPINPGENIPQTRTVRAPIPDDEYVYEYGGLALDNYNVLTERAQRGTRSEFPIRVGRRLYLGGNRSGVPNQQVGERGEALDADETTPRPRRRITLARGVVPREEPTPAPRQYQRDRRGREYTMRLGRRVYLDDEIADLFS